MNFESSNDDDDDEDDSSLDDTYEATASVMQYESEPTVAPAPKSHRTGPMWWCETDKALLACLQSQCAPSQCDQKYTKDTDMSFVHWEAVGKRCHVSAADAKDRWETLVHFIPRSRSIVEVIGACLRSFEIAQLSKVVLSVDDFSAKMAPKKRAPKAEKEKKAVRDPDLPRKSPSSYLLWAETQRSKILAANDGNQPKDMSSILGKGWRELPEKEKNIWSAKSKSEAEEYKQKLKVYLQAHPEARESKNLKVVQDHNAPEKPMPSAFHLFCADMRSRLDESLSFGDCQRALSEAWKKLPDKYHSIIVL